VSHHHAMFTWKRVHLFWALINLEEEDEEEEEKRGKSKPHV